MQNCQKREAYGQNKPKSLFKTEKYTIFAYLYKFLTHKITSKFLMKKAFFYHLHILLLLVSISAHAIKFEHLGIAEGLSQLSVMSIHQDRLGRMWFGTEEGLNMYDGQRIKVFKPRYKIDAHSEEGKDGLLGNNNYPITEDRSGNLYFCSDGKLIKFNLHSQVFQTVFPQGVSTVTSHNGTIWFACKNAIYEIVEDTARLFFNTPADLQITSLHVQANDLWIGSDDGLYTYNSQQGFQLFLPQAAIQSMYEDSRKNLWVATQNNGAYQIAPDRTLTRYVYERNNPNSISSNLVRCFTEDTTGKIWIGTFKGLNCLDTATGKCTFYTADDKHKLSHSSVFSLCRDQQGNIWVGTYYGGVNYFSPETSIFNYYSANDLHYPFVGSMLETPDNRLWICTEGGGLTCFNRADETFRNFPINWQQQGERMAHNNLKAICYHPASQRLFIGTHTGGLVSYHLQNRTFKHYYLQSPAYASQLGPVVDNLAIYQNQLIIQVRGGLYTMDLRTEAFAPLFNNPLYKSYWVHTFTVDSQGYIWIASHAKLSRIQMSHPDNARHYPLGKNGLGHFAITRIIETPEKEIYIGTRGSGLFKYDASSEQFLSYTQAKDQLLSDYCYDIAISPKGSLIVTGDKGITLFNPQTDKSQFIGLENNVPISAINIGCKVYVCQDGEIFVGGVDGLMSFKEEDIDIKQPESHLYFSTLWVNNQEIYPGEDNRILQTTLPAARKIELTHNENNILLQFASTNYTASTQSGVYEYRLIGFDEQWHTTNSYHIPYASLPVGHYQLVVREKSPKSPDYTPQQASLEIEIHPAWYQTVWAYLVYTLLTGYILFWFIRFYYSRMKLRAAVQLERADKERIQALNQSKINFFTTVSHEFRTPLTLIISQIELLMQGSPLPPNVYNRLIKVHKNAQSLKELISELLTFQKQEENVLNLQVKEIKMTPFLKEIHQSFSDFAETNQIDYKLTCHAPDATCWGDEKQLKKVFNNLLSNAFKYTDKQGEIELVINENDNELQIQVIDNGIGISLTDQTHIFELFYQASHEKENGYSLRGSGIGLALTKKIVEAHHGQISVRSQANYGSIFTVTLHKGKAHYANDTHVKFVEENTPSLPAAPELPVAPEETDMQPIEEKNTKHTILIVEDNIEMLQVLRNLFTPIYYVLTARNGKEGLAIALKQHPDIVLSDVMMPEMSGKELCAAIKNSYELSHIPVVLLSALESNEDKLDGLAQRADDYIGKPFNAKELVVRCNNLVYNRKQNKAETDKTEKEETPQILATNSQDQKFLDQVDAIIALNLSKEEFGINQLAQEMGIGRSSFYAKFKSLNGISPNEHLVNCRLRQAAHLLKNRPDMQIAEISYQVGFSSPRYFTKCFKSMYLISPTEYRKR